MIQILAGIRRGARLSPAIVEIAVQVDAIAAAVAVVVAILGPQAVGQARVLISVGIGQWQKVPVYVSHRLIRHTLAPQPGQFRYGVREGSGAKPVACLQSRVHENCPVFWVAIGDSDRGERERRLLNK